ncbi:phage tail tape measure protein [Cytobacillus depressus]|uniref:Phage tail tape measure protein n=1 Tax=Cytobacillus depressus TaxID=1602942 RepID=A0A6L3V9S3_9BACI|nr:phage tail tape measure protein [Cytobacillus depressus]KAB2337658.1 phage tail tape measure protein [Cytobacillus depressus]
MSLLGNLTVGILGNASGMSSTFTQAQNQVRQFGRQMQNIGSDLTTIGSTLTAAVTLPIVGLATASVKSAIDFETAFAGVRKTVDATEKEFAQFKKEILEMSKTIPAAATEIAIVAEAAGQLGIKKENIMGFTRTMVDLGVATNMSSDEAATALARLANITQMPQDQFDRLGATIVDLGNNLATTESEIVAMGLRIAGAGSQVGLTEAQILAFAGALSSVGIEAEAGGSAFSRVMIEIANASANGEDAIKAFSDVAGMSAKDFQKLFKEDSAGAIIAFVEGLDKMSKEGKNVFGVLEDLGLSEIRVRDALLRASGAGDLFRESLEIGTKAWEENVALTKEAEERYKTTASQFQILWNRVKLIGITIGDALIPALLSTLDAMSPLLDMLEQAAEWFKNLDPAIQVIIIAIGAIAAAIGPVLATLGLMITGIGSAITAFAGLSGAIGGAGGAIGILTGPIGIAVAAIVGLGATLVALWKNSETFRDSVTNIFNKVKDVAVQAFGIVASFIGEKIAQIKQFWDENGTQFLAAFENVFNGIMAVVDFVMPGILFIVDMVWTAIKQVIDGALNVIMGLIKVFSGLFTGDFGKMWEGIKQIFLGAIDLIIGWMTLTFVGGLRTLLTNLAKLGVNLVKGMADGIVGLFKAFTTSGQNLAKGFVDSVVGFFRNFVDAVITLFNLFKARGASTFEAFSGVVKSIFTSLGNGLKSLWEGLISFLINGATMIKNGITTAFNAMLSSIKSIWGTVNTTIQNLWGKVMAFFRGIDLRQVGKDIITGLVNGIGSMASAVWNKVKEIADGVSKTIKKVLGIASPSKVTTKLGEETGKGFADGIGKKQKEVEKAAKKNAQAAAKNFKEALDAANYRFKIGEVDAVAHIKSLEKVRANYAKTPDQVRKVNLAILDLEKKYVKELEALQKEKFDSSKNWIDKKKQMNELPLAEELAAWERVQARFKVGSKEREEAEQNIYRVKKEIHDKLTALNDEYVGKMQEINQKLIEGERALNDEYRKAVEDRTRSLYSFAGIFDEIKEKADVSGQQLIENLRGQVTTFAEWSANIKTLAHRGIDEGLLAELRGMGPQAAAEIAALNGLTDSQLQEYTELWRTKNEMARQQATEELEGLKKDTQKKIEELHANSATQLEKLRVKWDLKIKQIRQGSVGEFNAMKSSLTQIGKDSINGMINGLSSMEGALMEKAKSIADAVAATMRSALQIKSPSRVMVQIGNFVGEGLVIGLDDMVSMVTNSAKKLAYATIPNVPNIKIPKINASGGVNAGSGHTPFTGGGLIQNITINSPKHLSPAETARRNLQVSRQLAMEAGLLR